MELKMHIDKLIGFAILLLSTSVSAQSQTDFNSEACAAYRKSDEKLNRIYQQVLEQHKADAAFIAKLKTAQRAWLAFKDAEMEAVYPVEDKQFEYGSVYPMCSCAEQTALVNQRIEQLSSWLTAEEGDVCRGSR